MSLATHNGEPLEHYGRTVVWFRLRQNLTSAERALNAQDPRAGVNETRTPAVGMRRIQSKILSIPQIDGPRRYIGMGAKRRRRAARG